MSAYFNLITSESVFKDRYSSEKPRRFSELPKLAGSKWSREHLFACRVVRSATQNPLLPAYSQYSLAGNERLAPEIEEFLQGPNVEHLGQSEHSLVSTYGHSLGQVWAALAAFKGPLNHRPPVYSP